MIAMASGKRGEPSRQTGDGRLARLFCGGPNSAVTPMIKSDHYCWVLELFPNGPLAFSLTLRRATDLHFASARKSFEPIQGLHATRSLPAIFGLSLLLGLLS